MGSDHTLRHDDTPNDFSHQEGLVDLSPSRNFSLCPSTDATLIGPMSRRPDPGRGSSAFHDEMWDSGPGLSEERRHISASPYHSGTYPPSNEPWDPVGHPRVMKYDSGYVAFADSPKSSSDQSFCEVPSGPNASPQESIIDASQDARLESLSLGPPAVAYQQPLRWDVSIATFGPPRNDNTAWRDPDRRQRKGRRGPLDTQKAKDARLMRKIGVCWPCRVSKVKASFIEVVPKTTFLLNEYLQCSPGSTCQTCRGHQQSLSHLTYRVCCRSGFADFEVFYFPGKLSSTYQQALI